LVKKRQALAKASRQPKRDRELAKVKTQEPKSPKVAKRPKEDKESKSKTPPKKRLKRDDEDDQTSPIPVSNDVNGLKSQEYGPEISFVLLRHPNEKDLAQLSNKYLRTSRQLTVKHLCKFLAKKFDMSDFKLFKIGIYPNTQPLTEDLTLDTIDKELWKSAAELKLYYKLSTTA